MPRYDLFKITSDNRKLLDIAEFVKQFFSAISGKSFRNSRNAENMMADTGPSFLRYFFCRSGDCILLLLDNLKLFPGTIKSPHPQQYQ